MKDGNEIQLKPIELKLNESLIDFVNTAQKINGEIYIKQTKSGGLAILNCKSVKLESGSIFSPKTLYVCPQSSFMVIGISNQNIYGEIERMDNSLMEEINKDV